MRQRGASPLRTPAGLTIPLRTAKPLPMNPLFQFCPRCGAQSLQPDQSQCIECLECRFLFFRNPTVAVAGIVANPDGGVLLIRRAKNPAKDKLAFPGGFVDIDETVESALAREIREEVDLRVLQFRFLTSHPNRYEYRDIIYPVLDLFFVCETETLDATGQKEEVTSLEWVAPENVEPDSLAFDSMRHAWACYLSGVADKCGNRSI